MQINVTSKHLEMTTTIEEYAQSKAEKLTRFYPRIEQIDVKMEKTPHGFNVEIITDIERHDDIIGNANEDDLYAAIDSCVDKSVRQLTDLKNKLQDHKKHNTPTGGQEK
jgi:putative sigma-54 modulation protein